MFRKKERKKALPISFIIFPTHSNPSTFPNALSRYLHSHPTAVNKRPQKQPLAPSLLLLPRHIRSSTQVVTQHPFEPKQSKPYNQHQNQNQTQNQLRIQIYHHAPPTPTPPLAPLPSPTTPRVSRPPKPIPRPSDRRRLSQQWDCGLVGPL